jgi:hypothetical protein
MTSMLARLPVWTIGAFLGAAAGVAMALIAGGLIVPAELDLVRALAIAAAAGGAGFGWAAAHILAPRLLRSGERAAGGLPAARVLESAPRAD